MRPRWRARVGDLLPARIGVPLRHRFGGVESEVSLLKEFVEQGDLCVDVGAHRGRWTEAMRRAVGDSGYVIGIEPQNYLYDYLVAGFGRNSNVEFYNCALSDSVGTAKLTTPIHDGRPVPGHASLSHSPEEGLEEIVSIARLDDVLDGRRPKFIKIDVEGHELSVLRGGDLALQSKPVLVVEMCDYKIGGASARTFAHLTKYYEYHAKILSQNRVLQPLPAWPPESRLNTPNVVFLPDWA